jgi:hypothetical protein
MAVAVAEQFSDWVSQTQKKVEEMKVKNKQLKKGRSHSITNFCYPRLFPIRLRSWTRNFATSQTTFRGSVLLPDKHRKSRSR